MVTKNKRLAKACILGAVGVIIVFLAFILFARAYQRTWNTRADSVAEFMLASLHILDEVFLLEHRQDIADFLTPQLDNALDFRIRDVDVTFYIADLPAPSSFPDKELHARNIYINGNRVFSMQRYK